MKLEPIADFCRRLPGATEDIKWGNDLVFSVGGKMFCAFGIEKRGLTGLSFKVPEHRFLEYTDRPQFIPAPYLARAHWVQLVDAKGLTAARLKEAVRESHGLVFAKLPKKLQRQIGG